MNNNKLQNNAFLTLPHTNPNSKTTNFPSHLQTNRSTATATASYLSVEKPPISAQMFQEDGGASSVTSSSSPHQTMSFSPPLKPEERGLYLIHLLITCASHVASNDLENANTALDQISHLASPEGDTMQRIASYFSEALADKILRNWPGLYRAFHSTRVSIIAEELLVRKMFFEFLPIMKLSFLITNQAIVEAMEGEKMIHVIDLNAGEPSQWRALIRDLVSRPEGPPHLRITGIHQEKEVLDHMGHVLSEEAEKLDLGFQFNPVVSKLSNLDFDKLRVKTGEAVAVSSILQLHTLLACGDEKNSPSDDSASHHSPSLGTFLSGLWGLCPKVVVVTEQDCDHNGKGLMERVSESLYFYAALFDCLESALPRVSIERLRIEKMLLGEEIKNIIACEGGERKERHEKLEKWCQRLDMAGFKNAPLSYYGLLQARRVLQTYKCDGYKIREENGGVVICWHDRPLFSTSAWRFRR